MISCCRPRSFNVVKPLWLLFLCLITFKVSVFGQQKTVDGIIFDKDTKERIASVLIVNTRTKQSIYNNLQAEFKINAEPGDELIFSKYGYHSDTLKLKQSGTLTIYLKPTARMLKQVNITDTVQNPEKRLQSTKLEYSKAYGSASNRDLLSVSPGAGAGISIDALWNSFSRSGRNARRLQEVIERDYHENVIDYRFNRTLVASITGLKDERLADFMQKYRPSYYTVVYDSEYQFIEYIRGCYRRYSRNPRAYTLPVLVTPPSASQPKP